QDLGTLGALTEGDLEAPDLQLTDHRACTLISTRVGTTASTTKASPYGAAAAYAATPVSVQRLVARVRVPVGCSSRVAGSSFIAVSMTRAAPAAMPGPASGRVTRRSTSVRVLPRERATSSMRGLLIATEARTEPTAMGRKST